MVDTFKQKSKIISSIFYDDLVGMIMKFIPDDKVIRSRENFKYVKEELKMVSGRSQLVFKFIAYHKSLLSIRNRCRGTHLSWVWDDSPIISIFDEDGSYSGPVDLITDWEWHELDYSITGYGQGGEPIAEAEEVMDLYSVSSDETELSDLDGDF